MAPLLWTVDQAAESMRLSTRTVRRLIAAGELQAVRVRSRVRLQPEAVAEYVARCVGQAVGETTCKSASKIKTESISGATRRTGGQVSQTEAGAKLANLLGLGSQTIQEKRKQSASELDGSQARIKQFEKTAQKAKKLAQRSMT